MIAPLLEPLDIFLTRGAGRLSRMIRKMTRSKGEAPTVVNHVGIIMHPGIGLHAWGIEALLSGVKFHQLTGYETSQDTVYVYRPKGLTEGQKTRIFQRAIEFANMPYGYGKLLLQAADWLIGNRYFFRRIGRLDHWPICSYVVASAFEAAGLDFGVARFAASPDDLWDFIQAHPDKYELVWEKKPSDLG